MSDDSDFNPANCAVPLSIAELEAGLRVLHRGGDRDMFWDMNVVAFRQTLLMAIRETSEALLSPCLSERWRFELRSQVHALQRYLEIADDYVAERARSSRLN